jgi:DNA replication protein DnaC
MLMHPVIENLRKLRFKGMLEALEKQCSSHEMCSLSFEERLSMLVENEISVRDNMRLRTRLKKAKLKQNACMQEIDFRYSRGLEKALIKGLETGQWIASHRNVLIVGPTGTGKTYLGEALAHNACMNGYTAYHLRLPRFFNELLQKRGDGRYLKYMAELAKIDVLLLDDLGITPLTDEQRRDLLELIDERHCKKSTIVTSQMPVKLWHEAIGDKTLADAILDRLVHNAYKIELKGDSMRRLRESLIKSTNEEGK